MTYEHRDGLSCSEMEDELSDTIEALRAVTAERDDEHFWVGVRAEEANAAEAALAAERERTARLTAERDAAVSDLEHQTDRRAYWRERTARLTEALEKATKIERWRAQRMTVLEGVVRAAEEAMPAGDYAPLRPPASIDREKYAAFLVTLAAAGEEKTT